MISALKQKLEIMESFHCSSSSFDALNSFQQRRSSSVVVIGENESIPSPTFKSLKQIENTKGGSKIFQQRKRNPTAESSLSFSQQPLIMGESAAFLLPKSRSVSILPSIKQGKLIVVLSLF